MIVWGEALVKELASRRCIVFFGAGASAPCISADGKKKLLKWDELLRALIPKMKGGTGECDFAENLIAQGKYLDAAEVIVGNIGRADYVDAMRQIFDVPKYTHSQIHEAILKIDPKIAITTNFDRIYDLYCMEGDAAEGYNVFKHTDNHLVAQLRSPIRCVVKAHGCISDPDSMVLTRSEYFQARQNAPHFFRVLDALFLTHTILFVGYSLSDPDIQLTLENANISAKSSHRHYFITEAGMHPLIKRSSEKTYNIEILEFSQGNYAELEHSLIELSERVLEFREGNPNL